jgi:hypothetical protein
MQLFPELFLISDTLVCSLVTHISISLPKQSILLQTVNTTMLKISRQLYYSTNSSTRSEDNIVVGGINKATIDIYNSTETNQ